MDETVWYYSGETLSPVASRFALDLPLPIYFFFACSYISSPHYLSLGLRGWKFLGSGHEAFLAWTGGERS